MAGNPKFSAKLAIGRKSVSAANVRVADTTAGLRSGSYESATTCMCDPGSGRTGSGTATPLGSQAYVDAEGVQYKVSLVLDRDSVSIAAVDEAYRQKYSADPSLPLLLSDRARSTTSRLIPQS